ncbi:hypothetical protein SERLA73DRAFT_182190 [Serpula lacrymans var. lacrymans S7.3]|uniref:F-box domain-containing protein n=2 Tax=Serpula lacrymans var. lacrymans TaxID=341189 RepID=F8PWU4_SERL3|nr:uncharacterized protein SERLADRAFT_468728 [Serpula lacrymans var. lacrymans S7.9]EGN99271.1 hypothetical protein SERLA73DRAFT_182190 [Serpula lacrymans var. lacrymans S7.3]EGO24836.1 hypothetical protein SERLADRAFT_468728 [Serpula lacrymans var. lacrymans S7.9]
MPSLITLPEDILLAVCAQLSVADVLSLKQTCRVLHTFAENDYLWHQIILNVDLPLDIPFDVDPTSLSAFELQRIVVRAMMLDLRWRDTNMPTFKVTHLARDSRDNYVDKMQLLPGAQYLVTTQRRGGSTRTRLILWSLKDMRNPHHVASFNVAARVSSFHADLRDDGKEVHVAVVADLVTTLLLQVYAILLEDPITHMAESRLLFDSSSRGTIFLKGIPDRVIVRNNLVATSFIGRVPGSNMLLEWYIFFYNIATHAQVIAKPPDPVDPYQYSNMFLYPQRIALVSSGMAGLTMTVYSLPQAVLNHEPSKDANTLPHALPRQTLEPLTQKYCMCGEGGPRDSFFSDVLQHPKLPPPGISVLSFQESDASMAHFSVDLICTKDQQPVKLRPHGQVACSNGVTNAYLGATGRRAVWVERNWQGDEYVVIKKWSLSRTDDKEQSCSGPSALIPNFSCLPFDPRDCYTMAFDETTCRVCIGLASGEMYVLDII